MSALDTFLSRALARECEAFNRYREFEAWFSDRSLPELASRCRSLATGHREKYAELGGGSANDPSAAEWIAPEARELFYEMASPRQLLEVALDAELEALRFYEGAAAGDDSHVRTCAEILAGNAVHSVGAVVAAIDAVSPVDWEAVIALGGGPGLALGAERRLRAAALAR